MDIANGIHCSGSCIRRFPDRVMGGFVIDKNGLGVPQPRRNRFNTAESDPGRIALPAAVHMYYRRHGHDGEITVTSSKLQDRGACPGGRPRNSHRGQDFGRFENGGERTEEEVLTSDDSCATRSFNHQLTVQSEQGNRNLSCRIGVRHTSADRAPIPEGNVADMPERFRQQG